MPELPEVETARRGLAPHLEGQTIMELKVREHRLRLPIPDDMGEMLAGQQVRALRRRGKYLILDLQKGSVLIHLGMSGSLRVLPTITPPGPHDHLDLVLAGGRCLRLRDPRRFGLFLWAQDIPERHPLLCELGPEPLEEGFNGDYLFRQSRGRRRRLKGFVMDSRVVVGVGNIYASESLYLAGLRPDRHAGELDMVEYQALALAIVSVLTSAIAAGGTTLRDFVGEDGHPGYFARQLQVYGREGQPCIRCANPILRVKIEQRSSFYCPGCQT